MTFITIVAWIFGILFTLTLIARILAAATYTDTQRLIDRAAGIRRQFPVAIPFFVAVVCWVWIFTGGK